MKDFKPKKLPRQARSRATFDAIVEACARLLEARGYAALTTNHIARRAGVSIGTLYEYFPSKESVVYEVVRRVQVAFSDEAARPLELVARVSVEEAVRVWLLALVSAMRSRQGLLRAIADDVPRHLRDPHTRSAWTRHLALTRAAYELAGDRVRQDRVEEASFLVVTLVDAALNRLVLDPPADVDFDEALDELAVRVCSWVAASSTMPT